MICILRRKLIQQRSRKKHIPYSEIRSFTQVPCTPILSTSCSCSRRGSCCYDASASHGYGVPRTPKAHAPHLVQQPTWVRQHRPRSTLCHKSADRSSHLDLGGPHQGCCTREAPPPPPPTRDNQEAVGASACRTQGPSGAPARAAFLAMLCRRSEKGRTPVMDVCCASAARSVVQFLLPPGLGSRVRYSPVLMHHRRTGTQAHAHARPRSARPQAARHRRGS